MDATAPTAAAQEEGAAPEGEEIPPSEAAVKAPPEHKRTVAIAIATAFHTHHAHLHHEGHLQ